ncbi:M16 family metallopeptidase [Celeribacter sp.]|uniref:M16 family metallopeptidase n=1 Tax=Celeribacter sp. TaxID=1890673 RepID=UPI003A8E10D6
MIRILAACLFAIFTTSAQAAVEVQGITTSGGFKAWLVEEHSIPFTALEIRFRGGTALDREAKRGEINLMMALLEEGSGDMNAQAFAKARDDLAASYSFNAGMDSVSISAKFLTENRDEAVALLRQAILEPRFDEDAIERVKGQVYSVIRSAQTDPSEIASTTFYGQAFGAHPYGSSADGTLESVKGLTRDDMFTAYKNAMVKDRVYIGAVGDITAEDLSALIDDLLGDLPQSGPEMPATVTPAISGGVTVVPYETPQSVVLFGHAGIARDDENYIPAYIANEIFGGAAESRLMEEVREKRGLTYGIGAYLASHDHANLVVGQFSSANSAVAEAVQVVKDEWARIVRDGITAEELDIAKTYLTGAYALRFDGNAPIAKILVGMQMVGLSTDYIAKRNDLVNAVTLDEINRVARDLYDPQNLTFVVVGQPEGLEAE